MTKKIIKKSLVIGLIILFIGASVIPSISGNVSKIDTVENDSYNKLIDVKEKIISPLKTSDESECIPCEGRDGSLINIACLVSATFYDSCDVFYTGILTHPIVLVIAQGHWEADTLGLLGADDIECFYGGTFLLVGYRGTMGNLKRGPNDDGGYIGGGFCTLALGSCD